MSRRLPSRSESESPRTAQLPRESPDRTAARSRVSHSPLDPRDAYFTRVENYSPDPLLISHPSDLPSAQDDPIALDPEPIRTITPDSANDDAGVGAMTQLIP